MANIDSKYDSFVHFTIKFNSKDYSVSTFFRNIRFKIISPENSIKKLILKFEFGFIQF